MSVLEPNLQWLAQILETIDEGIHAVDGAGITIVYNGAAGRMDGLAPDDVVGRHVLSVFPSLGQDTSTLLSVLNTGRAIYNRPQTYTNFLGLKVHTVNTTLPILSAGAVVGALEIAKDLTQVKNLSEQVLALQARVVGGQRRRPAAGTRALPEAVYQFSHILTSAPQMMDVKHRAERAAGTTSSVLVYGETGTGKELLVQSIHNASNRRASPFLALNCAALPSSLLEGILFGTARGSFTGAEDRPGLFELADSGTLFLDEIQSMPLDLQAKLLRVLQEGEVMRVGDTSVRRLQVRVIAAMNQLPERAVDKGLLRPDLYYRINVVRLDVPPLRDRREDIELLTHHFIAKWNGRFGARVSGVDGAVMALFRRYPWPGNVRELENAIEAAMNLVSSGTLHWDALPRQMREWADTQADLGVSHTVDPALTGHAGYSAPALLPDSHVEGEFVAPIDVGASATQRGYAWTTPLVQAGMNDFWRRIGSGSSTHAGGPPATDATAPTWRTLQTVFEAMVLQRAFSACAGNVQQTARQLGIPRQTLQYRLQQLGIS